MTSLLTRLGTEPIEGSQQVLTFGVGGLIGVVTALAVLLVV